MMYGCPSGQVCVCMVNQGFKLETRFIKEKLGLLRILQVNNINLKCRVTDQLTDEAQVS